MKRKIMIGLLAVLAVVAFALYMQYRSAVHDAAVASANVYNAMHKCSEWKDKELYSEISASIDDKIKEVDNLEAPLGSIFDRYPLTITENGYNYILQSKYFLRNMKAYVDACGTRNEALLAIFTMQKNQDITVAWGGILAKNETSRAKADSLVQTATKACTDCAEKYAKFASSKERYSEWMKKASDSLSGQEMPAFLPEEADNLFTGIVHGQAAHFSEVLAQVLFGVKVGDVDDDTRNLKLKELMWKRVVVEGSFVE